METQLSLIIKMLDKTLQYYKKLIFKKAKPQKVENVNFI